MHFERRAGKVHRMRVYCTAFWYKLAIIQCFSETVLLTVRKKKKRKTHIFALHTVQSCSTVCQIQMYPCNSYVQCHQHKAGKNGMQLECLWGKFSSLLEASDTHDPINKRNLMISSRHDWFAMWPLFGCLPIRGQKACHSPYQFHLVYL